jgi:vacuolar-type H+-ATPase subunit I/STV1
MTEEPFVHETIAWAKQRLDEIDAMIAQAEKSAGDLNENARADADRALSRLVGSRAKLKQLLDELRTQADAAKNTVSQAQQALKDEWVEAESAFQAFLASAGDQTEIARNAIATRAEAQRKSWQAAVNDLRGQATAAVDKASDEFDAAIKRLSAATENAKAKIGHVSSAGDETWQAVRAGLLEAKAVHEKTIKKIAEALSKAF